MRLNKRSKPNSQQIELSTEKMFTLYLMNHLQLASFVCQITVKRLNFGTVCQTEDSNKSRTATYFPYIESTEFILVLTWF